MGKESDSNSEANTVKDAVESLVAGRVKRHTAGNRMDTLVQEEAGDEVTLLFAEDEEQVDDDFVDGENVSDDESDHSSSSSSSSESDGLATGSGMEDLSGERDLERLEKSERTRRRRQQEPWKTPRTMRPKIKGVAMNKRNDAESAVPEAGKLQQPRLQSSNPVDGPIRSSLRKYTVQNRHETNRRMQETKERRRQQAEAMEAAARRKESSKVQAMTQRDRMAEATRVELHNSKSLNRWETAESKRLEEQRARFAALRNRHLDGPVITWLSKKSTWFDASLVADGAERTEQHQGTQSGESMLFQTTAHRPQDVDPSFLRSNGVLAAGRSERSLEAPDIATWASTDAMQSQDIPTSSSRIPQQTVAEEMDLALPGSMPPTELGLLTHSNFKTAKLEISHKLSRPVQYATRNFVAFRNVDHGTVKDANGHSLNLAPRRRGNYKPSSNPACFGGRHSC